MEYSYICKIFVDGIDNIFATDKKEIENDNNTLRTFKMILFYVIVALFSKKKVLTKQIYFIGRPDKEQLSGREDSVSKIYRQRCIKTFKDVRNKTTILSVFGIKQRFRMIIQSINIGRKLSNQSLFDKDYFSYWIDYYMIWKFLEFSHPDLIIHRFHYDEKATWIGELKTEFNYNVEIYQHGVVAGTLNLPHRIIVDHMYCFDQYSVSYFKKEVLDNDVKEVTVYNFPDTIEFKTIPDDIGYNHIIGIAEQCNEKWTVNVVNRIIEENGDCLVYIMLHPQSHANYSCFDNYKNIKVTTEKVENLDSIVTYNSTLIIDYYRHNHDYMIFFMSERDKEIYQDYPFKYITDVLQCL